MSCFQNLLANSEKTCPRPLHSYKLCMVECFLFRKSPPQKKTSRSKGTKSGQSPGIFKPARECNKRTWQKSRVNRPEKQYENLNKFWGKLFLLNMNAAISVNTCKTDCQTCSFKTTYNELKFLQHDFSKIDETPTNLGGSANMSPLPHECSDTLCRVF